MTWVALVLVYPIWVLIHEGTHALVAIRFGCTIEKFRPWPHRLESGRFVWGSIRRHTPLGVTYRQRGWISFAPRVPALLACGALVTLSWLGEPVWVQVLFAGGAIDQVVNSIGLREGTDLRRWCSAWEHLPWTWRIAGGSVGVTALLLALVQHV
jgi:hypothetical protein